ncbi:MAG: hypothetical protein P4M09_29110 [Devosia sp.]|nr:hypothetical protein [Devosia sp.]
MAMVLAIALMVAPATALAGFDACQDGPRLMAHGEPISFGTHAHRSDRAEKLSMAQAGIAGQRGQQAHHDRNCCVLGCPACTPFFAPTYDLTASAGLALRYARSADVRGKGLAPSPLLGPPRFQA